ncbi:MAG: helix-hairpin-helix domain-containing protein [Deltaproteobacteria bacterium]|nr:helix-hairpin-helix domain-containing protein [Deltaproteobacteria bacterium]
MLPASTRIWLGLKLSLDRLSLDDLIALPGIGSKIAKRILESRRRQPFCRVEDLARVRGIGLKTVARLRPHLAASCRASSSGPEVKKKQKQRHRDDVGS